MVRSDDQQNDETVIDSDEGFPQKHVSQWNDAYRVNCHKVNCSFIAFRPASEHSDAAAWARKGEVPSPGVLKGTLTGRKRLVGLCIGPLLRAVRSQN